MGNDVGDHAWLYIRQNIITLQIENICVVMNAQIFLLTNFFFLGVEKLKFKKVW